MILTHKSSETTCATPGDYLVSWNRKPMGQRDLLASMTMVQDNLCQLQFPQSYIYHMEHGSLPITMTSCEMSVSHKVVFILKKKEKTLTYFVPLCYETGKKKTKLPYFCFFFQDILEEKHFIGSSANHYQVTFSSTKSLRKWFQTLSILFHVWLWSDKRIQWLKDNRLIIYNL